MTGARRPTCYIRIGPPRTTELRNSNAGARTVHAAREIQAPDQHAGGLKLAPGYPPVYNHFKTRRRKRGWNETLFVPLDRNACEDISARFARARLGERWIELCPPRIYSASTCDPATARRSVRAEAEEVDEVFCAKFAELMPRDLRRRLDSAKNAPAALYCFSRDLSPEPAERRSNPACPSA